MILGARAWVVQLRSAATGDTYHLRWGARVPFKDIGIFKSVIFCRQAELNAADDVAFTLSTNIGQSAQVILAFKAT